MTTKRGRQKGSKNKLLQKLKKQIDKNSLNHNYNTFSHCLMLASEEYVENYLLKFEYDPKLKRQVHTCKYFTPFNIGLFLKPNLKHKETFIQFLQRIFPNLGILDHL